MSEAFNEAQDMLQCRSCPWYKNCVIPMRVSADDLKRQMESSMPSSYTSGSSQELSQLLSGMASAAENSLIEGCPVFINRLRNNPELAQRIKKMMQEW
jgi:RecA/RadA recombinase